MESIYNFEEELSKYNLSPTTYEQVLDEIGKKMSGISDLDWKEIVDKYNIDCHYDSLRKASQTIFGNYFVREYLKSKKSEVDNKDNDNYLSDLDIKRRELEKERKKLQTEKLEYSRFLRENARDEMIIEKICESITSQPPLEIPAYIPPTKTNRSYLLAFGDLHDGISFEVRDLFGNIINSYSPEILESRMWDMCNQLIDLIREKNISELNIYNLGDNTQGILRLTSQLQLLRLGIIESTIHCSNLLAAFLTELSKYTRIKYQMVEDSNHDQLRIGGAPKNSFTGENTAKIIQWHLQEVLKDNPNITIISNPTGMNYGMMSTYSVLGIHGEVKNLAKSINEFSRAYNTPIDYIIGAHRHHNASEETGMKSESISIRSIIGVDPYGMSLNKVSDAGASLFTFDQLKGLVCEDRIVLN